MPGYTNQDILQALGIPFTGVGCAAVADFSGLGGGVGNGTFNVNDLTAAECDAILACINGGASQTTVNEFFQRLDFAAITDDQCGPIMQCIIDGATPAQFTEFLRKLTFTSLLPAQCVDIFECILNNGTDAQFTELLQKFDMSDLTAAQCTDIFACILTNGSSQQFTQLLNLFDMEDLTQAQCVDIFDCLLTHGTPVQFTQLLNKFDFSNMVADQCRDVFDCLLTNGTPAQYIELLGKFDMSNLTPDQCRDIATCIANDNTAVQTLINALNISGATIDAIDLAPTGNPNEIGVSITWTNGAGTQQTVGDPTPITINGGIVNFNTLSAAECQAIMDCINANALPGQYTTFINNVDWSTLGADECRAIFQCIIDNATPAQLTEFLGKQLENMTSAQCLIIAECISDNPAAMTLITQAIDFTDLTPTQITELQNVLGVSPFIDTQCYEAPAQAGNFTDTIVDPGPAFGELSGGTLNTMAAVNNGGGFTLPALDTLIASIPSDYLWQFRDLILWVQRGSGGAGDQPGVTITNVTQGVESSAVTAGARARQTFTFPVGFQHQAGDVYEFSGTFGAARIFNVGQSALDSARFVAGGSMPLGAVLDVSLPIERVFACNANGDWFELDKVTKTVTASADPATIAGITPCPPLSQAQEDAVKALIPALENELPLLCWVPDGSAPQALTAEIQALSNGTNVTATNDTGAPVIFSANVPGDIRTEGGAGPLEFQFSKPVNLVFTRFTDPDLLDPTIWTVNAGATLDDRVLSDGSIAYLPGSIDADLQLNEQIMVNGFPINELLSQSSVGVQANSDWGVVVVTEATTFSWRGFNNSAFNIMVTELKQQEVCDALQGLLGLPVFQTGALSVVQS